MYKIEDEAKIIALDMYRKGTYWTEDTPYRDYFVEGVINCIDFDDVYYEGKYKLSFVVIKYDENYLIGFYHPDFEYDYLSNLVKDKLSEEELMQNFYSHNYNKKLINNFKEEEREDLIEYLSAEGGAVWLYAKKENLDTMITKLKDFLVENELITGVKEND